MGTFTIIFIMSLSFVIFGFFASYFSFKKQLNEKKHWRSFKIFTIIFIISIIQNRTIQESINIRKQKQEKTFNFSKINNHSKNEYHFNYNDETFNFDAKIGERNDNNN